jgi:hypothetical protein
MQLTLRPRGWKQYVPPKRLYISSRLHGVKSQRLVLFKVTCISEFLSFSFCESRECQYSVLENVSA